MSKDPECKHIFVPCDYIVTTKDVERTNNFTTDYYKVATHKVKTVVCQKCLEKYDL